MPGVTIETDSVVDLSDITVFGTSGEWLYQTPSDSVLDEIRGDRWTRYGINSGNPVIVHREDAFERSEITIRDGKTEGSPSQTAFTALSRRDMAFVYSDSGYMTRRRFITPVLVLTDGDTVRDCPCEELSLIFDRSSAGGEQVGTVTERELRWHTGNPFRPVAFTYTRSTSRDSFPTITEGSLWVFPRDHDTNNEETRPSMRRVSEFERYGTGPGTALPQALKAAPEITLSEGMLRVSAPGKFSVTLCDLSGAVITRTSDAQGTYERDVSSLPSGGYVATAESEDGRSSLSFVL